MVSIPNNFAIKIIEQMASIPSERMKEKLVKIITFLRKGLGFRNRKRFKQKIFPHNIHVT
jgi:hypothetical protein